MLTFPNAKINLGLNVIRKRADGYHDIESCFAPVSWQEALEIVASETTGFSSSGIQIPGNPDDNLCLKAYRLMAADHQLPPVHIHLHKVLPIGAGLGGGSSDAAFAIKTINGIFRLNLSVEAMQGYARRLGSDCAFFIENKTVFASEKGDVFEPVNLFLGGYNVWLVYPNLHVSTAEAYAGLSPKIPLHSLRESITEPLNEWKNLLSNDFESTVSAKYPVIKEIKERLYALGAVYASMSGSGSAVYGIFDADYLQPAGEFGGFKTCFCSFL